MADEEREIERIVERRTPIEVNVPPSEVYLTIDTARRDTILLWLTIGVWVVAIASVVGLFV